MLLRADAHLGTVLNLTLFLHNPWPRRILNKQRKKVRMLKVAKTTLEIKQVLQLNQDCQRLLDEGKLVEVSDAHAHKPQSDT